MPLQSQLFRGDPKLEAAVVSDSAHIVPGARGDHVRKIQIALIQLDGAGITPDGIYGPATAAAVLAFKQKRNIINRSYQTKTDNIVGKMTMIALDQAMSNAPNPGEDQSPQVGAAILATLVRMDTALGPRNIYVSMPLRVRFESLRAAAALATKGNLNFGGRIRAEYDRGSLHLMEIGFARGPIVFAAAPAVAAGAAITALEIAIAALALILLLCIVSEDFRKEVSRLVQAALEAAAEAALSANQEASNVRRLVKRCKETNPNPKPKCRERMDEFDQKDTEFTSALREATQAIATATIRLLQISELERRALLVTVQKALVKLEKALQALKDVANALFDDCGCLFPKF
ncbi:MAG: peptidoglycan-binding protein [Candidatus Competibacteraceae bacterium]|nr:peptidoglycan-binding protein [Candidatus Competibacteraceae bacterium]